MSSTSIITDGARNALIQAVGRASHYAWVPDSNFPVGAALLTAGGTIVLGCNVENTGDPDLTSCAERTAFWTARSAGLLDEPALAIAVECVKGDPRNMRELNCCGTCKQVMADLLHPHAPVILVNRGVAVMETTHDVYSPNQFSLLARDPALRFANANPTYVTAAEVPAYTHAVLKRNEELDQAAIAAARHSFLVPSTTVGASGAAILTPDGTIVTGAFVANSSTGVSSGAVKNAVVRARCEGKLPYVNTIKAISVVWVGPDGRLQRRRPSLVDYQGLSDFAGPTTTVQLPGSLEMAPLLALVGGALTTSDRSSLGAALTPPEAH